MSLLESRIKFVPTGIRKVLYLNWPIILLTSAVASVSTSGRGGRRRSSWRARC